MREVGFRYKSWGFNFLHWMLFEELSFIKTVDVWQIEQLKFNKVYEISSGSYLLRLNFIDRCKLHKAPPQKNIKLYIQFEYISKEHISKYVFVQLHFAVVILEWDSLSSTIRIHKDFFFNVKSKMGAVGGLDWVTRFWSKMVFPILGAGPRSWSGGQKHVGNCHFTSSFVCFLLKKWWLMCFIVHPDVVHVLI